MNKQELLEKLTSNRDKCFEEANKYAVLSLDRQIVDSKALVYMQVINWIEQLAEQPKVTVPQFVADWFEANKHRLETAIWDLTTETYVTEPHQLSEIQLWLKESDSPYETLVRMKNGYEVEKIPVFPLSEGDLVIRKGKHEAKIYIVESVDESGVFLVNGIKDEFYSADDEGGPDNDLDYFYSNFRLLAKKELLEVEE